MYMMLGKAVAAMPWLILALSRLTNAACECGYSVNETSDASFAIFTDLLENDFLHTATDNLTEVGWRAQEYTVSAEDARGPFGKKFLVGNVESNPLKNADAWSGEGEHAGEAGLQLWVRGDHEQGFVSGAEMATVRGDAKYGSFRVGMKLSGSRGTCGAFFWFYSNSEEIDLEFLSKQFNESSGAVNLVLQTPMSVRNGYDASNTSEFRLQPLPFPPDTQFHEYRFDWTPESLEFFIDGEAVHQMTQMIPIQGGRMFMNHWSNGDPAWSAGPPAQDTALTVSYIKAYFNSTDDSRNTAYSERCPAYDPRRVCTIPWASVATSPKNGSSAETYFFSQDGDDHTPGQITYDTTNGAPHPRGSLISLYTYLPLLLALFSSMFWS